MAGDHVILLTNAVRWVMNLTNPMMRKGPVREIIPPGAPSVRVGLPNGCKVSAVMEGTEVPSIGVHEVVASICSRAG